MVKYVYTNFGGASVDRIQDKLLPDEQVLWTGKPSTKKIVGKYDMIHIGFVAFVSIVLAVMLTMALRGDLPMRGGSDSRMPVYVFIVIYSTVALYSVFFRFIYKKHMREKTDYYITNKRVIALRGKKIYKTDIKNVSNIILEPTFKDLCNMTFGRDVGISKYMIEFGLGYDKMAGDLPVIFFDVEDGIRARDLVMAEKNK